MRKLFPRKCNFCGTETIEFFHDDTEQFKICIYCKELESYESDIDISRLKNHDLKENEPHKFIPLKKAINRYFFGNMRFYSIFPESNVPEELIKAITVRNKDNMYMYTYNDFSHNIKDDSIVRLCRGLVVNEKGKILNFPFKRFFNEWEKERDKVDWDTAKIQEKLDGSLVCVFWNGNNWEITTKGSFYPNPKSDIDFSFEFDALFRNFEDSSREMINRFTLLDQRYCYMFELISDCNPIVTKYDEEMIYLIGARNLNTLKEVSQKELDVIAERLHLKRPRQFHVDNFEECRNLFDGFRDDEEGLVIVDDYFNRVKIKQESYIRLSKIKMLKEQDLFDYILGKTHIDVEYLEKLDEVKSKIGGMKRRWENIKENARDTFERIKDYPSRKEFAQEAKKYPYRSLLFLMYDNIDIDSKNWLWRNVIKMEGDDRDE